MVLFALVCDYVMACNCRLFIDFIGVFCVCRSVLFLSLCVFGVCFVCGALCFCLLFHWFVVRVWFAAIVSVSCLCSIMV